VTFRAENTTRGTVLASRCDRAGSFLSRGIGLLGRGGLRDGEGLLITRTSTITMVLMRFAIDAVFIDRSGRVVRAAERIRPWTLLLGARGADAVLELPAGTIERTRTQAGDVIRTT
jgi:uncharacterized membrane protein (UPF0127 family)